MYIDYSFAKVITILGLSKMKAEKMNRGNRSLSHLIEMGTDRFSDSPHFLYAMQLVTPIVVAIAVSMLISN